MRRLVVLGVLALVAGCGNSTPSVTPPPPPPVSGASAAPTIPSPAIIDAGASAATPATPAVPALAIDPHPLPNVVAPASLDYIAYESAGSRVWVPEGTTGNVFVFDTHAKTFATIGGFKTGEREARGQKRKVGPSAVSIGNGFAFIGNRATGEVCPVELATSKLGKCLKLAASTDGVAFIASAKEVWVTTPRDQSIVVLDASKPAALRVKTTIKVAGSPEGYTSDDASGRFFTNLEDKDGTLAIDVKTHKVVSTWSPKCGEQGPRGLAYEPSHHFLIVACTDHLQVLDTDHDGALLGKLDTGAGVDNLDLANGRIYAGAGKAAKLTVATVDEKGQLTIVATADTPPGARNAVVDADGNAYLTDAQAARLVIAQHP